jgi:hypothetical protein
MEYKLSRRLDKICVGSMLWKARQTHVRASGVGSNCLGNSKHPPALPCAEFAHSLCDNTIHIGVTRPHAPGFSETAIALPRWPRRFRQHLLRAAIFPAQPWKGIAAMPPNNGTAS